MVVSVSLVVAAGLFGPGVVRATDQPPPVRYQVSGPAVAQRIYYQNTAGQQHELDVPLPWSTEFQPAPGYPNQTLLVSAQAPGSVTCTISVNGVVVSQATAYGRPAHTVCAPVGPPVSRPPPHTRGP